MSPIWDIRFAKNEWPRFEAIRFWMRAPAGGAVRGRSGKGKFGSEMRNSPRKRLLWRDRGLIIPYLAATSHGGRPERKNEWPTIEAIRFCSDSQDFPDFENIFFAANKNPPREVEYHND